MIPTQLQKEDLRFVKLLKGSKEPFEKNWTLDCHTWNSPELQAWIQAGNNYGVIGGFGSLVILDFDDEATEKKYFPNLPTTFTVKSGSGKHHKYFICDEPKSFKVLDANKKTLVDVQGKGKQVVGPSSTHPNGNKYEVVDEAPIANIKLSRLQFLFADYLKDKDSYKNFEDDEVREIKRQIRIITLLQEYGYDVSRNPTMCRLGHDSVGQVCFSYAIDKDLWYCFHCDEGGDVLSFVMAHDKVDFAAAKEKLANMAGIRKKRKIRIVKNATGLLKLTDYIYNVEEFKKLQPFFYDRAGLFWFWNNSDKKWEIVDEIDLMNEIDDQLSFGGETVTKGVKANYVEAFKRVGRQCLPASPPKHWVQFKDKIFDIHTKEVLPAVPDYFICNPIPYELGESVETPVIDKLFKEWVGEEHVQTLYEILAYCCLPDYPIHLIFCFIGCGRNGKTKFQQLLTKFVGQQNACSTELDTLLDSRFESVKLFKKLICCLGETNFGTLSKTSLLKKLSGQDFIGFEIKNKTPFDDYNYAKILINSNSLPISEDTSEGFYRRWLIIDFPNSFPEGKDILVTVPEVEYKNLAFKVTRLLPGLLERGCFEGQGNLEERQQRYVMASNPFVKFAELCCYVDNPSLYVRYSALYLAYVKFLKVNKRRVISKKEFSKTLDLEGYEVRKTWKLVGGVSVNDRFVEMVDLKQEWDELCTFCAGCDRTLTPSRISGKPSENICTTSTMVTKILDFSNLIAVLPEIVSQIKIIHGKVGFADIENYCKMDTSISSGNIERALQQLKIKGIIYEPRPDNFEVLK